MRLRKPESPFAALSVLVGVVVALLVALPLGEVILGVFIADGRLDISGLVRAGRLAIEGDFILHTLVVVITSGGIALFLGAIMAVLNERTDARLGILTDSLPLATFVLPPIAGAIGWFLLLSPRAGYLNAGIRAAGEALGVSMGAEGPLNIFSWYGIILIYTLYLTPFSFIMVSAGVRSMDESLNEQSRVCGAGRIRTLFRVTLPALRPSFAGAILLMGWYAFAMYAVPVIIASRAGINILSVEIVNLLRFDYPPDTGAAIGLCVIVLCLMGGTWLFTRRLIRQRNFAIISGKGMRAATRTNLGFWKWPARSLILGYAGLTVICPMVALALVALKGYWASHDVIQGLSIEPFLRAIFQDPTTVDALVHSLVLAVLGATMGTTAAVIIAVYVLRSTGGLAKIFDAAIKLPGAVSTIVIAVGIIFAFAGPPFGLAGTLTILLLAYLVLYMPQASVSADTAAAQVGGELTEASLLSGAGPGRTFARISVPLMLPGLSAAWVLLFLRMIGDLNASALLSSTANRVVGFRILEVYRQGPVASLASLALVLTVVSMSMVVTLYFINGRIAKKYGMSQVSDTPIGWSGPPIGG